MEIYHHIVAEMLYVSNGTRVDIEIDVLFLCTRVSHNTDEDWIEIRILLQYLWVTVYMPRIIGANDLDILETYVDASYAVHQDTRGHTGD